MSLDERQRLALDRIQQNITRDGLHIYVVSGGACPRFAYTIGLSEKLGAELILPGAILFMADDVLQIVRGIASQLKSPIVPDASVLTIDSIGSFTLRKVDPSWGDELMLGALDFYGKTSVPAVQIIPDEAHLTIDIPDMSLPWSSETALAWRWLHAPWNYPIPEKSVATTNLAALRGERITEAARWEEDGWELFAGAGPDVTGDEMRVVPMETLFAADKSLHRVMSLAVGEALWRDAQSEWHPWPITN